MSRGRTVQSADRLFLALTGIVVLFGIIMLASASAPLGYAKFGDTYFFVKRQLLFGLLPGLALFLICARLPYQVFRKCAYLIFGLSIIGLVLVFIPGIGIVINSSRSWISIGSFSFQPSEVAKLAVIIVMAKLLSEQRDLADWRQGLLPILAMIAPVVVLIGAQPDVGTLSIIGVIIFGLLYLAGTPRVYLIILGLLGIIALTVLLLVAPYRVKRLTTFLHPELDPQGVGYQINQAFLAVGSGGVWGLGLGHSRQKFQYLPEVQADSIFAIIGEEMGFLVTAALVAVLAFLALRGLKIAKGAQDQFGSLMVSGIVLWFAWQSFLNISAIIGLLPLTGVPLPFISHGGSAFLVALAAVGIVANVSKSANISRS